MNIKTILTSVSMAALLAVSAHAMKENNEIIENNHTHSLSPRLNIKENEKENQLAKTRTSKWAFMEDLESRKPTTLPLFAEKFEHQELYKTAYEAAELIWMGKSLEPSHWEALEKGVETEKDPTLQGFFLDVLEDAYKTDKEKKDIPKAIAYYEKAADLGNRNAMHNLGYLYEHGPAGVEKDIKRSITYYEKATNLGNESAKEGLTGDFYL